MMRHILRVLLLLSVGCAQHRRWLTDTPTIMPVDADPRASMMKVGIGAYSPYAFQENPGRTNIGMDLSVGKEMAVFTSADGPKETVPLGPKQQIIGLWLPVSFHMLWDLNDASSAIVNTDYRFGGIVKYARGVGTQGWLNEWGVRFTPLMHESTHLGDELTLSGQRRNPATFERINPSQFFTETLVSLHHYGDVKTGVSSVRPSRTFLRFGFDYSWTGLYGSDTLFTRNHRVIPEASSRFQPIVQLEYVFGKRYPITDPAPSERFEPFISTDVRRSIVFDYEKARTSDPDKHTMSVNLMLGLRRADRLTRRGVSDFFVRVYHGVNPHGQFRNQTNFWLVMTGLSLDP